MNPLVAAAVIASLGFEGEAVEVEPCRPLPRNGPPVVDTYKPPSGGWAKAVARHERKRAKRKAQRDARRRQR